MPFWKARSTPQVLQRVEPSLPPKPAREPLKVSQAALLSAMASRTPKPHVNPFVMPEYAPGVIPDHARAQMAMDWNPGPDGQGGLYGWAGGYNDAFIEGIGFMGYPYLAALSQRSEYRQPCQILAEEKTRKWIKLTTAGKEKSDKIKRLEAAMKRFELRGKFCQATELEAMYGISFLHPNFGEEMQDPELSTKLLINRNKIEKGSLRGFNVVDPTWCAPNTYNTTNPLDPTFYRPQMWWVLSQQVHVSRMLTFVSLPVPDILKPAYNFGGLSQMQLMKPYVDNWLRVRQGVTDLVCAFTVFTLGTNMESILQGGAAQSLDVRLKLFATMRNNLGLMAIDKEQETLTNISAPLGTLDQLQAQAQEHMAAAARTPLVKLFGITPSGLNASSDGEIRTYYDSIHAAQERDFTAPLKTCLDILQLNEFGEIDEDIGFEYLPLWELDEAAKAAIQKTKIDIDAVACNEIGAVGPEQVLQRLANDPESIYHGLDLPTEAPGPPAQEVEEPDEENGEGSEAHQERASKERDGV